MKRDAISRASEAGFSLVELLVSLVLLSMVAAILASGLSLGQIVWRRSEEHVQASRAMFDAQAALRRLLDNMQPLRAAPKMRGLLSFAGVPIRSKASCRFPISAWAGSIACIFFGEGASGVSILLSMPREGKGERHRRDESHYARK